jgi:GTPase
MQENNMRKNDEVDVLQTDPNRAILVSICLDKKKYTGIQSSLDEMELLASTVNIKTVGKFIQNKKKISSATFVGKGFLEMLKAKMIEEDAGILIFDNELSPTQGRNLIKDFQIRAFDRTEIILRIFHDHAKSNEAKLQVKMAEMQYELPRLKNKWTHFEKQRVAAGGGRGAGQAARGMGETQTEIDRRRVREEIKKISGKLAKISKQKDTQYKKRNEMFRKVCLVGYTNAGKSTLFNNITNAGVLVQDQLFATLDTTSRTFNTGKGKDLMISDTVGFIANLPHHLVASFRATLKDVLNADLLLHVIDAADPGFEKNIIEVNKVLKQIKADEINTLMVFNKADKVESLQTKTEFIEQNYPKSVIVSAVTGFHVEKLMQEIDNELNYAKHFNLFVPHTEQKVINHVHEIAKIISKKHLEAGVEFQVELNKADLGILENYCI